MNPSNPEPVLSAYELKRKYVNRICGEFLKTANAENAHLYSLTITPHQSKIFKMGIWFDLRKRECFVLDLYDLFELTLNRFMNNNWKAKPFKPLYILGAIEHAKKNSTTLVSPHIHAIAVIHPLYQPKYQSLISSANDLNLDCFPFASWINRKSEIASIKTSRLETDRDIVEWGDYSFRAERVLCSESSKENKFTFNTREVRNGQMRSSEGLNTVVGQS